MLRRLRKNMKSIIVVVAAVFALSIFGGIGYMGFKKDARTEGIAKVNGRPVDVRRFQQTLEGLFNNIPGRKNPQQLAYLQILALNQVIEYSLMLEDAGHRRIKTRNEEVDSTIKQIMDANKITDINILKENLKSRGLEFGEFKKMIRDDIILQKLVQQIKSGASVKPEDLREVSARHILIRPKVKMGTDETYEDAKERADKEAEKLAQDLLGRIRAGEKFESLAAEYSDDPGNAGNGGDLGYFNVGTMVPEFTAVAFSLKPGEISDVVKTDFGYHIIRVDDTRLIKVKEGKKLKDEILKQKQDLAVTEWMRGLKAKAKIEIINPMFKGHDLRTKGRPKEALEEYRKAIAGNPPNAFLYLLLGDAYLEMNQLELEIGRAHV